MQWKIKLKFPSWMHDDVKMKINLPAKNYKEGLCNYVKKHS